MTFSLATFEAFAIPDEVRTRGRLSFDGADFDFADGEEISESSHKWLNPGITWTVGQTVSVSLWAPIPDRLRETYDWCFNRMSGQACADAIGRWETVTEEITLQDNRDHCPATNQIRKATTGGIKCERTFDPLPPGGALAEAWGVTKVAPPAETTDDWDGTERPCDQQGHGYYVLPTNRHHGLGKGCHYHNGPRQDLGNVQWSGHHEHKFVNRH